MLMAWIWDPERGRVSISVPENVKRHMFRRVAEGIVNNFPKREEFTPKDIAEKYDITQQTAKTYLQEMAKQNLIKWYARDPVTAYHLGCTPLEELDANIRSVSTGIGNRMFKRISRRGKQVNAFIAGHEPLLPFRRNRPLLNQILNRILSTSVFTAFDPPRIPL